MDPFRMCLSMLGIIGCSFAQELCSDVLGKVTQITALEDKLSLEIVIETGLEVEVVWILNRVPIISNENYTIATTQAGTTTRSKMLVDRSQPTHRGMSFRAWVALKGCQTHTFEASFSTSDNLRNEIALGTIESTRAVLFIEDDPGRVELNVRVTVPANKTEFDGSRRSPVDAYRWRYRFTTNGTIKHTQLHSSGNGNFVKSSWLSAGELYRYQRFNVIKSPDRLRDTGLCCVFVNYYGNFRRSRPSVQTCVAVQTRADMGVVKGMDVRLMEVLDRTTNPGNEDTIDAYGSVPLADGMANGLKVAVFGYPAPPITVYKVHNREIVKPVTVENNGVYTMNWYYLPVNKDAQETWTAEAGNQGRIIPFTRMKPIWTLGSHRQTRYLKPGIHYIEWTCAATGFPRPNITFYEMNWPFRSFANVAEDAKRVIQSYKTLTSTDMIASMVRMHVRNNTIANFACKISNLYENRGKLLHVRTLAYK
ncbi:uncharacterized protein LOC141912053 [Tubulanus polymorphus]|uniref:uncharacterized protein LOC141912053 n=1 Tax=Tubulanus polymorphus TaxID=672921 RepID=UPI003DA4EF22